MRQSHTRQAPIAIALGGACLFTIGIAGCSRDAGLDLAKDEVKTDSVIAERASDSILRSRQELAGTAGKPGAKGLVEAQPEFDERPSLASRWKSPFRAAGNLLKRKPDDDEISDPFLARRQEEAAAEERQALANAAKSAADLAKTSTIDSKSLTGAAGEKKVALADTSAKSGSAAAAPRPKSSMSSESRAALDEFLKSQEPVAVADRALADRDSLAITRKPGTSARTASTARTTESAAGSAAVALDDSAEGISRTGVKAGRARPFPGSAGEAGAEESKSVAAARKTMPDHATRTTVASASAVRRNPLLDEGSEAEEAEARTKKATGLAIAALLKKARDAGDVGEFDEARTYATAASELAEQCAYEFAAREPSPEKVVAWLEAKREQAAETSIRPRTTERRQIVATRRPARETMATPTAFEKRTAEDIFAEEVEATVAGVQQDSADESSFQEWAAGVGKTPVAKGPSPNWPVLSPRELAASDDLWQPSRSEFQQQWTDLRTNRAPQEKMPTETRLASAESEAPPFVATAQAEHSEHAMASARPSDPIVQLGEPTDLAPGAIASSGRRGPRLAAPPPLSIDDAATPRSAAKATRASKQARTIWFATIGGLAVLVLLAFRRWAYRTQAE